MKNFFLSKRLKVIAIILSAIIFFSTCIEKEKKAVVVVNNAGKQFAGSTRCLDCHSDMYHSFLKTGHYNTSAAASAGTVMGSFESGKNLFSYSYYAKVGMEKRDSGLYQVEYNKNFEAKQSHRFDVVIGSGTRGQSYLSWVKNRLIQLPVSFFTSAGSWANSPGYPYAQPLFSRSISARCLECHSTYFKTMLPENIQYPEFNRNQVILGVQCETCHGPAADHAIYHEQHPGEAKGKFIQNPLYFTRKQKLDLCGYCHGGIKQSEKPAFSFEPGDTLSATLQMASAAEDPHDVEVHDNQYGLLSRSKCFQLSSDMTCNTCHNTHEPERGKVALFSSRCMNCHTEGKIKFCKMAPMLGKRITQNCIDCHMPKKQSKMLTLQLEGSNNNEPSTLRSHVIAIYPDEAKKYISLIKNLR